MAKAIISSILEAQLGKYVDGLRSDSLVVGLWSGELELRDLALKPHALAELQLPVTVTSGTVARVHVAVPWNQLGSASVTVALEGVSALVVPNSQRPSAAELRQAKRNQLERQELLRQHRRFAACVDSKELSASSARANSEDESTFVSRLTARIVANLQVTLRDVHLRYEDVVANPEAPFACGFLLERFRFHTTDEEGNDAFVDQTTARTDFTHKAAEIVRLGVYWDRLPPGDPRARLETGRDIPRAMRDMVQTVNAEENVEGDGRRWLLRPCSLGVQLAKNESADYSTAAKYAVQARVEALSGSLSREQYEDVLFLQRAFLGRRAVEQHFALARGRPLHSPGARPREWWDYALRLVLVQRRAQLRRQAGRKTKSSTGKRYRRRVRWSSVHQALLEQQLYVEAFRMELRNGKPLDPEHRQAKLKKRYEEIYPLDVIMALRDAAEDAEERYRQEKAEAKKSVEVQKQTKAAQSGGSWYSYFFGTNAAADTAKDEQDHVLTAEGRENLREAYDDAVEKATSEQYAVPSGCNLVSVKLQLLDGSLALFQSNAYVEPFVTATLSGSLAVNVQPEDEWDASFRLQHFAILNGRARGSRFHTFCMPSATPSQAADHPSLPCVSVDLSKRSVKTFSDQSGDVDATLQVRVRTQPVRAMVDPSFLLFLHAFFVSLLPDQQLEKAWRFATSSVADWMFSDDLDGEQKLLESDPGATTRDGEEEEAELIRSLEKAQGSVAYDVEVNMDAPVLILPENVEELTGAVVVVDLGQLSFHNDEEAAAMETATALSLGASTSLASRRLHWKLEMHNIHVLLGRQEQLTQWTDQELRMFAKVVDELTLEFAVSTQAATSRLKLPKRGAGMLSGDPNDLKPLPQVIVRAVVPRVTISLTEEQLVALGRIHSSVLAQAAAIARSNDKRLSFFDAEQDDADGESAAGASEGEPSDDEETASTPPVVGDEKFLLEVQLSLATIELNVRESAKKDAFLVRASQTSFAVAAFSAHQEFRARLQALVMEDKLYTPESCFYELISTGSSDGQSSVDTDVPHLIAVDVTAFPMDPKEKHPRYNSRPSQLEVDVHVNVLHLQWNPSSVALVYRIASSYASAVQFHDDDLTLADAALSPTAGKSPLKSTASEAAKALESATIQKTNATTLASGERCPLVVVRASLVQFSVTFNKDQLDRQLVRLELMNSAINFTSYDAGDVSNSTPVQEEGDTFKVMGHVGNFVGTDLSTAKHPLYSPLIGLDESETCHESAKAESGALLTFGFVCDPAKSDKSSLRLAFRPIRVVYFHQQILEFVDFLLEGVLGALVGQTLMNATQMLLREDEASVVLDLSVQKPAVILPLSLQDAPHAKVTADVLRLVHYPSSAVHYEGPVGARTKRLVRDERLPRPIVHHPASEGGGVSLRVDCKDIFLEKVHIYGTMTSSSDPESDGDGPPRYHDLLSVPPDLTISVEDLVSSSISLNDEEVEKKEGKGPVFLPRITVESVLPPLEIHLSRTNYLAIVALVLENFGADELENAPRGVDAAVPPSSGDSTSSILNASQLARSISADHLLPSLRPTVKYTYLEETEPVTLYLRFAMEKVHIQLLQDGTSGVEDTASTEVLVDQALKPTGSGEALLGGAFAEIVATDFSLVFNQEHNKNPNLVVILGAFSARDLVGALQTSVGGTATDRCDGTLLVSPQPLEVHYTWDEVALTGELNLLFAQVTGTVIPEALLSVVDFFMLPTKPARLENSGGTSAETADETTPNQPIEVKPTTPAPSLITRRQSITDILREGKEPELELTIHVKATQVGIAVPRDAYDPQSPRVAFTGDFALDFLWIPDSKKKPSTDEDSDLDIQSSLLAGARNMEVVLENASRPGCCVASAAKTSGGKWDAIEVASQIQLLEPCDLHVEVSDLFPHAGQRQQIVALRFTPIDVFVSYEDSCVALDTIEALTDSFTRHEENRRRASGLRHSPRPSHADLNTQTALTPSASESTKSPAPIAEMNEEIHRYFTCELPSVSLTLINDCDGCDMGLAQLQIERCHLFLNVTYTPVPEDDEVEAAALFAASAVPTTALSGGGNFVALISYYNPDTRDWHPMCTEWGLDASVQGAISSESELHVILTASQPLDLTVTHGLLEVMASVGGAWKRRTAALAAEKERGESRQYEDEESVRHKRAPCVIRNETGLSLNFWLTNGSFTTEPQAVPTGGLADLRYLHASGRGRGVVRRYASNDRDAANLRLCLQLLDAADSSSIPRFQAVQGLIFEQLGARAFPLMDTGGQRTSFTLCCSAQLVEGHILLVVSSPIKLVNRLDSGRPVALLVNDPAWRAPVEIGVLGPRQESAVPVLLSLASELRVRPMADRERAHCSWSAPIPIQTRAPVELKVEAAAASTSASRAGEYGHDHRGGRGAVYCVAMATEQELRVVAIAEPLVLVNKLPVPVTYRVRSSYGTYDGGNGSPTKPETVAVGAKASVWWTDVAQRPLFQLTVEGCTAPSKWLELAPRNTKSGAVLGVMLSRVDDGRPFRLLVRVVGGTEHAARPVRVELLAEVWVVNRSGLELVYGTAADGEAYAPPRAARAQVGNAQISAYSSDNSGKTPVIRIGLRGCNWSPRFEADPRRLSWQDECLTLRSAGSQAGAGVLYELGVSADYATRHFGSVTTLVSVIPRYLVLNRTAYTLLLLESPVRQQQRLEDASGGNDNIAHHVLGAGDMYALYWVGGARARLQASVLPDDGQSTTFCSDGYDWSTPFSVDRVASTELLVPPRSSGRGVGLEVVVKRGSLSQATFVVVITEQGGLISSSGSPSSASGLVPAGSSVSSSAPVAASGTAGWQNFSLHAQVAGVIVTIADKKKDSAARGDTVQSLFTDGDDVSEPVARVTLTRIGVEASWSPRGTAAKLTLMGLKMEDLLPHSKYRVVLRPLLQSDGASMSKTGAEDKYFLEVTYLERPHAKYTWVERVHVELQDVKLATSMRFVDRLDALLKETLAHFQHRSLASAFPGELDEGDGESEDDENLLSYFVPHREEGGDAEAADMAAMTGRKLYIASGEIAPVRVVVSFTRDKSDAAEHQSGRNESFWLANLKLKIDNACVTLAAYRLSHALATEEALGAALARFYEQSVKSQALGLIDSIEVTSLVTSMVAGGVTSLVSTLRGKADPAAAAAGAFSALGMSSQGRLTRGASRAASGGDDGVGASQPTAFRFEQLSNGAIMRKHSRALSVCDSSAEFLRQVRHLVYDWDANHTGLEARGCVALVLQNNSRHALVVNTQLNDGAELRVLPLGRRHLASVLGSEDVTTANTGSGDAAGGSAAVWRPDRALVVFAYGYTPTLLTSGDVYFTVQSNACSVFVSRKTARLKANRGYTATFTLQETQSWWATHMVIIGDDLQASASTVSSSESSSLFGDAVAARSEEDEDEYEVTFSGGALGLVAKQSGRVVMVRECVPSGAAQASGRVAPGDVILAVNGVSVSNTTQFKTLVSTAPRPLVLRLRASGRRSNAAFDLFGERQPAAASGAPSSSRDGDDAFDLFGSSRG